MHKNSRDRVFRENCDVARLRRSNPGPTPRTLAADADGNRRSQRRNHLVFTPMLPEVVGRTISPLHVVVAGRQLTRRTKWLEAQVSRIDRENNEAHYVCRDGNGGCNALQTFGAGMRFDGKSRGNSRLASRAYALKTVIDAIAMGNDLIGNFEAAATEPQREARQRLLTVVVIGGGFSGVETAAYCRPDAGDPTVLSRVEK